ncbi:bifunctional 3,4-dihydroxy-2-butanone-4-phosphate synthase/GTP cyclohydrolase II [Streptomyces canus]|uniref:bifunctional 3,4-dihydroxy-2-butanone-4-phosphate synthase/GTP cyclohydrolase II n=1 Tax=Streptomyces canus TaxID=58343 RepID=UPI003677365B
MSIQAEMEAPTPAHQRVEAALVALRAGRLILVLDDEDRENEGDLVIAAEYATPEAMTFMIGHTSGLLCVAMTRERAEELRLPLMVAEGDDPRGTAFTVTVDAREGTTTGVSGSDRAVTVRALVDPRTRPADLTRPGHVFPLIAREGGVLHRTGHTEATVDLCRLAGLEPVGVLAEVMNDDGTMARRPDLQRMSEEYGIPSLTVADLVRYRSDRGFLVARASNGRVPSRHGTFTAVSYRSAIDDTEHVALCLGDIDQRTGDPAPVLTRVHSECLTGDVFGSARCDCGEQLDAAMARIATAGRGVVVYLRGHEGRGVGLSHKLRAYTLQDAGLDTVDANLAQGLPVDARDSGVGAQILTDLGVSRISLMSNNPAKYRGLSNHGLTIVTREPIMVPPNAENLKYLQTKRMRMDHVLDVHSTS